MRSFLLVGKALKTSDHLFAGKTERIFYCLPVLPAIFFDTNFCIPWLQLLCLPVRSFSKDGSHTYTALYEAAILLTLEQ
jgi:hypothetical protein